MLTIDSMTKVYPASGGVAGGGARDISLDLPAGSWLTLLGPSGCGKSTTLRCVAGLEDPDAGRIAIQGRPVFSADEKINVSAHQRGLGMVFQSYAIWPHMSVFDNVAFPLTVKGRRTGKDVRQKVREALRVVRMEEFEGRPVTKLSGGQQQRLAFARAIAASPDVLLLDEPLSNLDADLRAQMRFELKRMQHELGVTTLYVTHDQEEAMGLSDQVAVVMAGRVVQVGEPSAIYTRPATAAVARFIGAANLLPARVVGREGSATAVELEDGQILRCTGDVHYAIGEEVTAIVRPETISVADGGATLATGPDNEVEAVVAGSMYLGSHRAHQLTIAGTVIAAKTDPEVILATGARTRVRLPVAACQLLPAGERGPDIRAGDPVDNLRPV